MEAFLAVTHPSPRRYAEKKPDHALKKKLYSDGKFVGWYDSTGDDKKDAENISEILKKRGLRNEIGQVDRIVGQAYSFGILANSAFKEGFTNPPFKPAFVAPFIVNAAFSLELYLKAIHQISGGSIRGHKLKELFESLDENTKDEIEEYTTKDKHYKVLNDGEKFQEALFEVSDAFVDWRYLHENDSSNSVRVQVMNLLMRVLNTYVHVKK